MQDRFGRTITYMRVSVTDLCNLRCRYCMPEEGIDQKLTHPEMMTEDELVNAVRAAAELGVRKIRLTGGEPLVKKKDHDQRNPSAALRKRAEGSGSRSCQHQPGHLKSVKICPHDQTRPF